MFASTSIAVPGMIEVQQPDGGGIAGKPWPNSDVEFSADSQDYFRIWIANLALSLATLGIYSAWSKVRRTRYLYGHVHLNDRTFDFHADPFRLLKGRLIAVVVVLLWTLLGLTIARYQFSVPQPHKIFGYLTTFCVAAVVAPLLVVAVAKFKTRNLRYGDLRFNFVGTYSKAMTTFGFWLLLSVVTAGLLYPVARYYATRYVVSNTTCGGKTFEFSGSLRSLYMLYFEAVASLFVFTLFMSILFFFAKMIISPEILKFAGTVYWVFALTFFFGYLKATNARYVFENLQLGKLEFRCTLDRYDYALIYAINAIAIALSVGLLVPWAKIRTMRVLLTSIGTSAVGSLNDLHTEQIKYSDAAGEESEELLDIEL